jgi:ABC-2 type transport system ATP-binding protein
MKQRLLIARALLHRPQILFLDEPTRGLDPTSAKEIRATIGVLSSAGVTIFLTTHYMEEADELCHRVAFIAKGEIVALDTPRNLKLKHGQRLVTVSANGHGSQTFSLSNPEDTQRLASLIGVGQLSTIHTHEASLDEVFVQLVGQESEK